MSYTRRHSKFQTVENKPNDSIRWNEVWRLRGRCLRNDGRYLEREDARKIMRLSLVQFQLLADRYEPITIVNMFTVNVLYLANMSNGYYWLSF